MRLRTRAEFLSVQERGRRASGSLLTVLGLPNSHAYDRLGVIASRKLGGAVLRNRVKRRVRELFRHQHPEQARALGYRPLDLVVIPRREAARVSFEKLQLELRSALGRLDRARRT